MTSRWSSEDIVSEHRDVQASAMAVDQSGQFALLAGKRALAVVNLDNPNEDVRKVPRQSKWEINAVQWNPHEYHTNHFIAACNQRADIWTWDQHRHEQRGSLKAHTRVISDLDWSPFNPETVATCSVDTFTYLWDIRDVRKPTQSLQGISGVSQVKWNKVNSHLLATCHDGDIRVWDPRKGNTPIQYIAGHLSKIFGLDWSPENESYLATSSQDCTVKFWDINNPRQCTDKLTTTGSPVWRARYTPFGNGLVTVVVPQLRRGENSLFLWNCSDLREPVHTFVGHTDVVLEFQWRNMSRDGTYQLVTWSKDQTLRRWVVDELRQKLCGIDIENGIELNGEMAIIHPSASEPQFQQHSASPANSNASDQTSGQNIGMELKLTATPPKNGFGFRRDENIQSPLQPKSLQQEFALVNFDNVTLDETDVQRRTCTVSAESSNGKYQVKLTMLFPEDYPNNVPPSFKFVDSNIDEEKQNKIVTCLEDTAKQHVRYSRSCIDPCLSRLATQINLVMEDDKDEDNTSESSFKMHQYKYYKSHMSPYQYMPIQDQAVPFPRTSGARFCSNGVLVCFTRQVETVQRRTSCSIDVTPRAMAQLSAYSLTNQVQSARTSQTYKKSIYGLPRSPPSESNVLLNYYQYIDMHNSLRDKKKPSRSRSRSRHSDRSDSAGQLNRSPKKEKQAINKTKVGPVVIYNAACLMPFEAQLAEKYVMDTDNMKQMCTQNASLAASVGRRDLVQLWSLLSMVTSPRLKPEINPDKGEPFAQHPFGRKMLKSLINYYSSIKDVQSLAMITCTLGSKFDPDKAPSSGQVSKSSSDQYVPMSSNGSGNYNTYHTIHATDTSLKNCAISVSKMKRSSSLSDVLGDYVFAPQRDPVQVEKEMHQQSVRLLDMSRVPQYDMFKLSYADMLYRLGLLSQRAQVLKYVSVAPEPHTGIEFKSNCVHCGNESRGVQCWHTMCRQYAFRCDICHIAVKGSSSFCLACGHGGHTSHMMEWFKSHDVCPTGCGCNCLQTNPMSPEQGS